MSDFNYIYFSSFMSIYLKSKVSLQIFFETFIVGTEIVTKGEFFKIIVTGFFVKAFLLTA